MRLSLEFDDLDFLKTNLKKYHPQISSSKRIEAAARGLGFKSNASFRAALQDTPQEVVINDLIFSEYLSLPSSKAVSLRSLSRSVLRTTAKKILNANPSITFNGFDSTFPHTSEERNMTIPERQAAFEKRRIKSLDDSSMDQLELALIYLDMQERRKTFNKDFGSYRLKHRAENLSRKQGLFTHLGDYVSNGMLIVAAKIRGFKCKQISYNSYNAYLNISSKTIRATANEPLLTNPQQWQLFEMALAANN